MKTIDVSSGNTEQAVRLFFSIDLAGASRFKYLTAAKDGDPGWPSTFIRFFEMAANRFRILLDASAREFGHDSYSVEFWKTLGDEILFYSTQTDVTQPYWQMRAFASAVAELHKDLQRDFDGALGAKGIVWSAGFPIRNKRVLVDMTSGTSVYEGDEETTADVSVNMPTPSSIVDFMGLEMDQGFRLGAHAYPGRLVASPDSAFLAARGYQVAAGVLPSASVQDVAVGQLVSSHPEFRVLQVGWETLKGVLGEFPVPIIWAEFIPADADSPATRQLRYSFEAGRSAHAAQYLRATAMDATKYRTFFSRWSKDLQSVGVAHITPYVHADSHIDQTHLRLLQTPGLVSAAPVIFDPRSTSNA